MTFGFCKCYNYVSERPFFEIRDKLLHKAYFGKRPSSRQIQVTSVASAHLKSEVCRKKKYKMMSNKVNEVPLNQR